MRRFTHPTTNRLGFPINPFALSPVMALPFIYATYEGKRKEPVSLTSGSNFDCLYTKTTELDVPKSIARVVSMMAFNTEDTSTRKPMDEGQAIAVPYELNDGFA